MLRGPRQYRSVAERKAKRRLSPWPFCWWPREEQKEEYYEHVKGQIKFHALCGEKVEIRFNTNAKTVPIQQHWCPKITSKSGLYEAIGLMNAPAKDVVNTIEEVILWHIQHLKG